MAGYQGSENVSVLRAKPTAKDRAKGSVGETQGNCLSDHKRKSPFVDGDVGEAEAAELRLGALLAPP